ncbi:RidA family protein [Desulfothermus naphthae]
MKRIVKTNKAPQAIGPYSQGVIAGNFLFISGQIAIDPDKNEMIAGTIEEQAEQVLKNIGAILNEAGLTYDNVVKTTVYLTDLNDFGKMNEVYSRFFKNNPPARAAIQVSKLPKGAKIEIEAIASLK